MKEPAVRDWVSVQECDGCDGVFGRAGDGQRFDRLFTRLLAYTWLAFECRHSEM